MKANEPLHVSDAGRWPALDGWRGISIALVLLGHMLPLGPKWLQLNAMVSAAGLSIFFFLSGFLVISMLLRNDDLVSFGIRRALRILPLAWLSLAVVLSIQQSDFQTWFANILFYANIAHGTLLPHADHLWSLSVEVQFYFAIALILALFGRRGLFLVPVACVLVTLARIVHGAGFSILTWYRIDEILVGGCVALLLQSRRPAVRQPPISLIPFLIVLLLLSSHQELVWLNYLRPYVTAALIYSTLSAGGRMGNILTSRPLRYLAQTSYALYVIHPLTYAGWLGEGDVVVRYTKRLLSFFLTFCFAHLSTFYYERFWNLLAHQITRQKKVGPSSTLRSQPLT